MARVGRQLPKTNRKCLYSGSLTAVMLVFLGALLLPAPFGPRLVYMTYWSTRHFENGTEEVSSGENGDFIVPSEDYSALSLVSPSPSPPARSSDPANDSNALAYLEEVLEHPTVPKSKRTIVILLSHGRSGSTLAERLIFSTTNIFFLDEPFRRPFMIKKKNRWSNETDLTTGVLSLLENCEFPPDERSSLFYNWQRHRMKRMEWPPWAMLPSEFETGRKTHSTAGMEAERPVRKYINVLATRMQAYCSRSSMTAMKSIRLTHPGKRAPGKESMITTLLSQHANIKIIHLVRHPYEVDESMRKLSFSSRKNDMNDSCNSTDTDNLAGVGGGWEEEGRYMLITYEGLVTEPEHTVRQVHTFMGVEYIGDGEDDHLDAKSVDATFEVVGRSVTSKKRVKDAIDDSMRETGPSVGITSTDTKKEKMTNFSVVRKKVSCGPCSTEAEAEIKNAAACSRMVSRFNLQCCK